LSLTQLRKLMNGESIEKMKFLYADTQYCGQPCRITSVFDTDTRWKYVAHYNKATAVTGCQEELYDLDWDPGEHRNLLMDRSQHPIRADWNCQNLWQEWHPYSTVFNANDSFDDYDADEIARTHKHLRTQIASVWGDGLIKFFECHINKLNNSMHDQFYNLAQLLPQLEPHQQLARVSEVFTSLKTSDFRENSNK